MGKSLRCRMLTAEDAEIFRELRLQACREEPVAFTEGYEELEGLPPEYFRRYFDNGWIAGAFLGMELVGLAGLFRHRGQKVAHKGTVWGVYADPQVRGQGVARRLIEMVMAEAREAGIELVHLSTDATNPVTIKLYESLGFERWGVDKDYARVDGRPIDEVMMKKNLKANDQ